MLESGIDPATVRFEVGRPAYCKYSIQASFPPPRNHAAAVAMCREHSNFEVNE